MANLGNLFKKEIEVYKKNKNSEIERLADLKLDKELKELKKAGGY